MEDVDIATRCCAEPDHGRDEGEVPYPAIAFPTMGVAWVRVGTFAAPADSGWAVVMNRPTRFLVAHDSCSSAGCVHLLRNESSRPTGPSIGVVPLTPIEQRLRWEAVRGSKSAADKLISSINLRHGTRAQSEAGDNARLLRVIRALNDWSDVQVSVERAARSVGISIWHLCRDFRRLTGTSPYSYSLQSRVNTAMGRLVRDPRANLTDLALDLGFCSSSHFGQVFKQRTGMPPSSFARQR